MLEMYFAMASAMFFVLGLITIMTAFEDWKEEGCKRGILELLKAVAFFAIGTLLCILATS